MDTCDKFIYIEILKAEEVVPEEGRKVRSGKKCRRPRLCQ